MRSILIAIVSALISISILGQSAPDEAKPAASELHPIGLASGPKPLSISSEHQQLGIVSDWSQRHVVFPAPKSLAVASRIEHEPRWTQSWFLRHRETWWPGSPRGRFRSFEGSHRDWSAPLGTATFQPLFDFTFDIFSELGFASLNTMDQLNGQVLATAGTLNVTAGNDVGTYPLRPGGPNLTTTLDGIFTYNNLLFPNFPVTNPFIDDNGLLFSGSGKEINFWFNNSNDYEYYDYAGGGYIDQLGAPGGLTLHTDPGGGQTFPAKYVFDVTAAPDCTKDYVVIGIPATPAPGGQANIVGYNNLYSGASGFCSGSGPNVMFAYASGTGEVPASIALSPDGTQLAYVEDQFTGASIFHVLKWAPGEGTSATAAVAPDPGNDQTVLLSPCDGATNQSSTTSPFINYAANSAYVTTYSWNSGGSGCLYKISNAFGTPVIAWSVSVTAVPSSPVYDGQSNNIYFTDSDGRIDYVTDSGSLPPVNYGPVLASGTTSLNPVTVDSTNEMVYATFNTNGTNAIVVQAPIASLSSAVSVPVGTGTTTHTGPYGVDFNNDWYTGGPNPLLYVAGTGTGTQPTLYSIGFTNGVLNSAPSASAALTTGMADASDVTEFYNANLAQDFLFVGVTNNCIATTGGGTAGCVMSLNITGGFPTVDSGTTAIAALGGSTGIIIDNDNLSDAQASSIYYATKNGVTPGSGVNSGAPSLVKATQSGLN